MTGAPAIAVEGLSVMAGDTRLLAPISFELPEGATLVVMGETGAGKSLMAQAILGALPRGLTASGTVWLGGERIDTLPERARATLWGRKVAMLPQEPWRALDPLMAAAPQVAETHRLVAGRGGREAARATAADFATLGLTGAERRLPGALSGGMAQRVAFAAATAGGAPILIADEPTKGLDADRRDAVIALLAGVATEGGSLLAITHDVTVARRLGGEAMLLKDGALVEAGPVGDLLATPRSAYARAFVAAAPEAWPRPPAATIGAPVLEAEGVAVDRGGRRLVEGFDLALGAGEKIAISGQSGSGKTSLLDVLAGLLPPAAGTVRRAPGVGRTGVQKLYQDPPAAFPPSLTLGRALDDVRRLHGVERGVLSDLLRRLKIAPAILERRPDGVSGGELQRIALARVLSIAPSVVLADEPTSRLDPITQAEVMALIAATVVETGTAIVLVTHDDAVASRWADRAMALPAPQLIAA
ncbi:MAG: ATP-binding cassette domain-containing protein [Pseudomonadota bacterium]